MRDPFFLPCGAGPEYHALSSYLLASDSPFTCIRPFASIYSHAHLLTAPWATARDSDGNEARWRRNHRECAPGDATSELRRFDTCHILVTPSVKVPLSQRPIPTSCNSSLSSTTTYHACNQHKRSTLPSFPRPSTMNVDPGLSLPIHQYLSLPHSFDLPCTLRDYDRIIKSITRSIRTRAEERRGTLMYKLDENARFSENVPVPASVAGRPCTLSSYEGLQYSVWPLAQFLVSPTPRCIPSNFGPDSHNPE